MPEKETADGSPQKETRDDVVRELRELYNEAVEPKDRLAIRKELNKVLGHYNPQAAEADADSAESETLDEIRSHLEPLGLAPCGTPLPELARLAALKITEK